MINTILIFSITMVMTGVVEFLFARHIRKAEEELRKNETDDKFTVRYGKFSFHFGLAMLFIGVLFVVVAIAGFFGIIDADMEPIDILISSLIFAALFLIGGIMFVLWYLNRKIIIDGDTITSVSMSKKRTVMKFSDITGRRPIGFTTRSGYVIKTDQYMANLDRFTKKLEKYAPHVMGK